MTKVSKPFNFKKFTIEHDKCAMKVGFDGALLGVWAEHSNPKKILDIGTGSGLISLILRQRFPASEIYAIEPNSNAIIQSNINFNNSPFKKRIMLFETKFQEFSTKVKFDLILSNPPFFSEDKGSDNLDRNEARQEKFLPIEELISGAKTLLNESGKFFFIYPTWETEKVIKSIKYFNLFISVQTVIHSRLEKTSKRTIFEIQKEPCVTENKIFISGNQDVGFSHEYKKLMKDFYTIF